MQHRAILVSLSVVLLCAASGRSQSASPFPDAKAAFARLKSLAGEWEGHAMTPDGPPMKSEFRLTGNGSALAERLFPGSDHEMLSVYYLDGGDLVLTHYCAMGNQPHMKLVAGGAEGALLFDFVGGSNIDPRKGSHMHAGRFDSITKDSYEADWSVFTDGQAAGDKRFFMSRAGVGAK
jgi:hypothetical protein